NFLSGGFHVGGSRNKSKAPKSGYARRPSHDRRACPLSSFRCFYQTPHGNLFSLSSRFSPIADPGYSSFHHGLFSGWYPQSPRNSSSSAPPCPPCRELNLYTLIHVRHEARVPNHRLYSKLHLTFLYDSLECLDAQRKCQP